MIMSTASITQEQIFTALRTFILSVLGEIEVVQGLDNRVPQPKGGFVVMSPLYLQRLSTNIDSYHDPYEETPPIEEIGTQTSKLIATEPNHRNGRSFFLRCCGIRMGAMRSRRM